MKTVVLTFDDGLESHYNFVRPLLIERNLKGTFFITNHSAWSSSAIEVMREKDMVENNLDFNCLKDMVAEGFEIGNHTFNHPPLTNIGDEKRIIREVENMNDVLSSHGIERPKTFCYPGYLSNERVASVIESLGFTHARIGYSSEGDSIWSHWGSCPKRDCYCGGIHSWLRHSIDISEIVRPRFYYPNDNESKWLIKVTGVVNFVYKFNNFVKDVEEIPDGAYGIFVFHGLKNQELADDFKKIVDFIAERDDVNTINFKDLP